MNARVGRETILGGERDLAVVSGASEPFADELFTDSYDNDVSRIDEVSKIEVDVRRWRQGSRLLCRARRDGSGPRQ